MWETQYEIDVANTLKGFMLLDTGGGCLAWQYGFDHGNEILITDTQGVNVPCEELTPIWVGLHNPEGEMIELTEWMNLSEFLACW